MGFVNGKITKPEVDAPKANVWGKVNSMVIAWVYNVIDKTLHGSVAYADAAHTIWTDFEKHYSQGSSI